MPTRLAARKWPSSCTNTSTPSTNTKCENGGHAQNLRLSILPRGPPPENTRGPTGRPRAPRRATPPRPARCASIVRSMTSAIDGKPMRPSRNRATATSLAAFSTTGRLRSASSARYARRRHGNASVSGDVEVEAARAREIERRQRRGPALGIRKRVLNRQPHVGHAKLCNDRAVGRARPSSARPTAGG